MDISVGGYVDRIKSTCVSVVDRTKAADAAKGLVEPLTQDVECLSEISTLPFPLYEYGFPI